MAEHRRPTAAPVPSTVPNTASNQPPHPGFFIGANMPTPPRPTVYTPQAEAVEWALAAIDRELLHRPPAATLMAEHLAVVMLIHVLRLHLAREPRAVSGWLAGLADPAVAAALRAMHEAPARSWTVADLARVGAVSRSTLAARFKDTVGQGPLEYLTRWRIQLASRRLRDGTETMAAIARSVGYGSESALSVAFKRVTGVSPRDYRRRES